MLNDFLYTDFLYIDFLYTDFLYIDFLYTDFLYIDFLFTDFLYIDFLYTYFLYTDFLYIDFLYIDFLYIDFLYIDFLYIDFLYIDFLYIDFLYIDFLYTDFLYTDFLYIDFLYTDKMIWGRITRPTAHKSVGPSDLWHGPQYSTIFMGNRQYLWGIDNIYGDSVVCNFLGTTTINFHFFNGIVPLGADRSHFLNKLLFENSKKVHKTNIFLCN